MPGIFYVYFEVFTGTDYFMQFVPLTGLVSANVFYSELRLVVARHRYETSTSAVIAAHR